MDLIYKIVVLGDLGVGKSSIVKRYINNFFSNTYMATMGMEYFEKIIYAKEEKEVKMSIWEASGRETLRSMWSPYYGDAVGVLLVYDLTNLESFKNVSKWYNDIATRANTSAVFLLVGTKSDLKPNRKVSTEEAEKYAKSHGFIFYETSSLSNENVEELFKKLQDEIYDRRLGCIYYLENQSVSTKNDTLLTNVKEHPRTKTKRQGECCPGGITGCIWNWLLKR